MRTCVACRNASSLSEQYKWLQLGPNGRAGWLDPAGGLFSGWKVTLARFFFSLQDYTKCGVILRSGPGQVTHNTEGIQGIL